MEATISAMDMVQARRERGDSPNEFSTWHYWIAFAASARRSFAFAVA